VPKEQATIAIDPVSRPFRRNIEPACGQPRHMPCFVPRRPAKSKPWGDDDMSPQMPVVSLEPIVRGDAGADATVARDVKAALGSWGAFELVDHGVPTETIAGAFAAAGDFFRLPVEERLKVRVDRNNRGYAPLHQTHYPGNLPDLKESFNIGTRLTADDPDVKAGKPLHGVNQWPDLPSFRAAVEGYFDAILALGDRLLGPLALCLDLSAAELRARYRKPVAFMRLFHYPPNSNVAQKEFGAAEHKDYGFLTILAQDSTGGLEVRAPTGELVLAPPNPRHFIVNAGDMLSEMTGDAIRSAPHRVINRAGIGRYSIPFFYDPDFDARFASLPEYSAGEFLLAKFNKFYKHGKELSEPAA
jgi:isopenicillin N synthase-like dioxygenase